MLAREAAWRRLHEPHDLLVIGGGITGAAVLWEAARRGLRAVLVERSDFASGTSSRSSKLVHGGLRYLKEGKIGLTRESVREREELLRDAPGLVDPLPFLMPHYRKRKPSRATLAAGLAIYDVLAGSWQHRYIGRDEALALVPSLDTDELEGAHCYVDATTDDARLVMRLIHEACLAGATAINYVEALVTARMVRCRVRSCATKPAEAKCTCAPRRRSRRPGVFADRLRGALGAAPRLRPLRGSHLILPDWRLPLAQSVAFEHPHDGRPVFAYPWQGRTLVGTTDIDHDRSLDEEPAITPAEVAYLVAAVRYQFPSPRIDSVDTIATYAGVRPVIDGGSADPSRASRDHAVWNERGLVTDYRRKADDVSPDGDGCTCRSGHASCRTSTERCARCFRERRCRESSRLDDDRATALGRALRRTRKRDRRCAKTGELDAIDGTGILWAELRWAAEHEAVVHLDDLLLRRTRLGLLDGRRRRAALRAHRERSAVQRSDGAIRAGTPRSKPIALRWNESYRVPEPSQIPDWREYL